MLERLAESLRRSLHLFQGRRPLRERRRERLALAVAHWSHVPRYELFSKSFHEFYRGGSILIAKRHARDDCRHHALHNDPVTWLLLQASRHQSSGNSIRVEVA